MPETQSREKKDLLRLIGAELRLVPAAPYKDPGNYVHVSGRLAEELAADRAERRGLGEPVRQPRQPRRAMGRRPGRRSGRRPMAGIDAFTCAVGTGGTLAGVGAGPEGAQARRAHRARRPDGQRRSIPGSRRGELKAEGNSITEGIGQGRVTGNLERRADRRRRADSGCRGAEPGLRPAAARGHLRRRLGRHQRRRPRSGWRAQLGPGHTIVTILCDWRRALPVQAVQPGLPAWQGPARAGLAVATDASPGSSDGNHRTRALPSAPATRPGRPGPRPLLCYPGLHAVWLHRLAHRAVAPAAALAGALRLPYRPLPDRHRDPPGARPSAGACSSTTAWAWSSARRPRSATTC